MINAVHSKATVNSKGRETKVIKLLWMDTGNIKPAIPSENLMWQNAYLDFMLYSSLININNNFPISKYREELWSSMMLYYSSCIDAHNMGTSGEQDEVKNKRKWNDRIFYVENNIMYLM